MDGALPDIAQRPESYIYLPLRASKKEIRLLVVHPGSPSEPVSATLQHVSLDSKPNYEAISYVWGDASIRASISIAGKKLDVPTSAERAIRRMREERNDRVLWIDAVCINQADIDERGQQVTLMGSIYSYTQRTLAWLGDSNESTSAAIETIRALYEDLLQAPNNLGLLCDMMQTGIASSRYSESNEYCPHDTEPLQQFFSNPWFGRLWCVQEVALAPCSIMICGECELDFIQVLRVAGWIRYKLSCLDPAPFMNANWLDRPLLLLPLIDRDCGFFKRFGSNRSLSLPMVVLFNYSRDFDTSDQHDSVFAILGLAKAVKDKYQSQFLKPGYDKSFEHVVRDAAIASIWEHGSVWMFVFACGHVDDNGEPSIAPLWIPCLRAKHSTSIHACHMQGLHHTAEAWPSQDLRIATYRYLLPGEPNVLRLHGIVVDCVARTTSMLPIPGLDDESIDGEIFVETIIPTYFFDIMTALDDADDDREHWFSNLAKISTAGISESELSGNILDDLPQLLQTCFPELLDSRVDSNALLTEGSVLRYFYNRRIFCTSAGLIGLGPRWTQPFDIAVVVHGFPLPVILRPVDDMGDIALQEHIGGVGRQGTGVECAKRYRFIGDCYINGIMHGEAVRSYRQTGGEEQVFEVV